MLLAGKETKLARRMGAEKIVDSGEQALCRGVQKARGIREHKGWRPNELAAK